MTESKYGQRSQQEALGGRSGSNPVAIDLEDDSDEYILS